MRVFVTGTDTNVGKTIISSWLCLHTGYSYFKPIQTGSIKNTDSKVIKNLIYSYIDKSYIDKIYKEQFVYKAAVSPHLAAALEQKTININKINFIKYNNVIIEGAGGVLVPISKKILMIDLIKKSSASVIIVAKSILGTINHTLLTIEALRARNIMVLGVILNLIQDQSHKQDRDHIKSIEFYGDTKVLACIPRLKNINTNNLLRIKFTRQLQQIFNKK